MLEGEPTTQSQKAVGVLDIPVVFLAPRQLFRRTENVKVYGWPLVILLTAMAVIGYATIETGLIDNEVQQQVMVRKAKLEEQQHNVVERSQLKKELEDAEKLGEFERVMTRLGVVAAKPVMMLVTILFVASVLYGAVALSGKKPEWHTLMNICVFAAFVQLFAEGLRLVLMLRCGRLRVDTSAALLAGLISPEQVGGAQNQVMLSVMLSAIDPFRIWFWLLVVSGLIVTTQLTRWKARIVCTLCWLIAAIGHVGLAYSQVTRSAG